MLSSRHITRAASLSSILKKPCRTFHRELSPFSTMSASESLTTTQKLLQGLQHALGPLPHCELINESHMHNVPKGSESHFKLIIVSDAFQNLPLVQRHRKVFQAVNAELQANGGSVHALSITAKTPAEWGVIQSEGGLSEAMKRSPPCLGGDKKKT